MANLLIAVGGTGQHIALAAARLARLGALDSKVWHCCVIDADSGSALSTDLTELGSTLDDSAKEHPLPGGNAVHPPLDTSAMVSGHHNFAGLFLSGPTPPVETEVLDALFAERDRLLNIDEGMFGNPSVGATVFARNPETALAEVFSATAAVGPTDHIFVAGSLVGGTGAGITHQLIAALKKREITPNLHGLFLLPWFTLADSKGGIDDKKLQSNMLHGLEYLYAETRNYLRSATLLGIPDVVQAGSVDKPRVGGDTPGEVRSALHLIAARALTKVPDRVTVDGNLGAQCSVYSFGVGAGGIQALYDVDWAPVPGKDGARSLRSWCHEAAYLREILKLITSDDFRGRIEKKFGALGGFGAATPITEGLYNTILQHKGKKKQLVAEFADRLLRRWKKLDAQLLYCITWVEELLGGSGFKTNPGFLRALEDPKAEIDAAWGTAKGVATFPKQTTTLDATTLADRFVKKLARHYRGSATDPRAGAPGGGQGAAHWLLPRLPASKIPSSLGFSPFQGPDDAILEKWRPSANEITATAFATPYARCEELSFLQGTPGLARPLKGTLLRSKLLIEGVVLGLLKIEILDLETDCDDLGSALLRASPDHRYLTVFRLDAPDGSPIVGVGHHRSLITPSATASAEPRIWTDLAAAVTGHASQSEVAPMLAEWRASIPSDWWNPDAIPWMHFIDHLIGAAPPHPEGRNLRLNARMVGPVFLNVQKGDRQQGQRFYLPTLAPGFSQRVVESAWCDHKETQGTVAFTDVRGSVGLSVALPPVAAGQDILALGGGIALAGTGPFVAPRQTRGRYPFDDAAPESLFSEFNKVYSRLREEGGGRIDVEAIIRCPCAYPDIVRVLLDRFGTEAVPLEVGGATFSPAAQALARDPAGPGMPTQNDLKEEHTEGVAVSFTVGTNQRDAIYLERLRGRWVGDLWAVGYLLWVVFTGEASVADGRVQDQDASWLASGDHLRPFDAFPDVYKLHDDQDLREVVSGRLATLQRYRRTYDDLLQAPEGSQLEPGEVLCAAAVRVFLAWATVGDDVIANGRPSVRGLTLPTGGGLSLVAATTTTTTTTTGARS